jgi:hypothetical protein
MGGGFGSAHIGGGFEGGHVGGPMNGGRQFSRGFHRGRGFEGFEDYGYANDCPAYSSYYRPNRWDCNW